MWKETIYWNHYKTQPHMKDVFIFFHIGTFYKTFETDAVILSQLFWFKITLQEGLRTAAFLENSTFYLERLKNADFSYVVLELQDDGNIATLHKNVGNRSLDLTIPLDTFLWFLSDIQNLHDRYATSLRMIQPIDLPLDEQWWKYKITDVYLPEQEWDSKNKENKTVKWKVLQTDNKLPL